VRGWMQVYGLNAKVAELESDLHDVVRGLVRCNLDVQNMKVNLLTVSVNSAVGDDVC